MRLEKKRIAPLKPFQTPNVQSLSIHQSQDAIALLLIDPKAPEALVQLTMQIELNARETRRSNPEQFLPTVSISYLI
jgi:hypothetical protein